MSHWIGNVGSQIDIDVLEESAIAAAQSTIYNAMEAAGISKSELARRMGCNRSLITRILTGSHNLTVRTMARSLAACGFEMRCHYVPIEWNWTASECTYEEEALPAHAGSARPTELGVALALLATAA